MPYTKHCGNQQAHLEHVWENGEELTGSITRFCPGTYVAEKCEVYQQHPPHTWVKDDGVMHHCNGEGDTNMPHYKQCPSTSPHGPHDWKVSEEDDGCWRCEGHTPCNMIKPHGPHSCKLPYNEGGGDVWCAGVEGEPILHKPHDPVNHPRHYTFGKYEVIDVINDWGLGFDLGNAVKYIARAGRKDPSKFIEDLEKAQFYLNYHIAKVRGEH